MTAFNILVLCTGNSARSILLESIFNTSSEGRIMGFSAGSNPTGKVHPQSIKLLTSLGHDVSGARSKSWDEFATRDAPKMGAVITVCGSAAAETCPFWPGVPLRSHWGVDDPADCTDNYTDDCDAAFHLAYDILARRAAELLAVPFENMSAPEMKATLDRVGKLL